MALVLLLFAGEIILKNITYNSKANAALPKLCGGRQILSRKWKNSPGKRSNTFYKQNLFMEKNGNTAEASLSFNKWLGRFLK